MANHDALFHGLSDATRRAVIARLSEGAASVSELAATHDMALPSFLKHLRVLEAGGWIETEKTGRVRTCRLRSETVLEAEHWLARQRTRWEARLDRLEAFLARTTDEGGPR